MSASSKIASTKIAKFAWIALAYTLFVILFGAFVRASLSGDGCGAHWPTCHGGLLPHTDFASFAEYTHRITSGLTLVLVGALALASHRVFGRIASVVSGKRSRFASLHPATRASLWALFFTIVSALIGAVLVLFEFVALDRSLGRAITMPLHLINTLFLLGSLGLAGHYARGGDPIQWKGQGAAKAVFLLMAGSMMVLGATGAISALGKTAWQFENVTQSFAAHFAADAHPLLRGGIVHPLLATSVGLLIIWGCGFLAHLRNDPQTKKWARVTVGLYVVQFVFGIVNLLMSAPVWMQLTHLALACFNWLALIMVGAYALRPSYAVVEEPVKDPAPQSAAVSQPRPTVTAYIKDFIAMTKPRVISLLLFTTVAAMVVAQGGWPPLWLILVTCLGGYMMAGASNSFNMLVETDLDQAMGRTAKRPIVSGRISRRAGWIFAFGM
ncbi:MAG: COX15/CtaA family protein, partial [Fimbriimonadaceae bacterium]